MQHGYKTQHSTVTALHTLNNTVAKGFNQMAPPARTIIVALDMSKAFDTINIHTLIRKLLQTNIPGTIIKFIANYIKGRKAYTTYRNHTSKQRQFKTGVPQGGVLSPTLFNIYTSDLPSPSAPVQVMAYADDITITSTHTSTSAAKKYIQPYLHKVLAWTKQNNHLPKTHIQHTHPQHLSTSTQTSTNHKSTSLQQDGVNRRRHSWLPIKQLWDRLWSMPLLYGRLLHPRPALTNCKSCRTQHWELPQDAHKTQTYNICMMKHSHSPYTSTYSSTPHNTNRKTQHPSHPLHKHTTYFNTPRLKKNTIFNNGRYTTNIPTDPHTVTTTDIKTNMLHIHTSIVSRHLATRGNNKILRTPPPHTSSSEEILPPPHSSHPCPAQNKQISLPQIILTQSRRQNTSITTMPPL